jgi:hypothetical protein
VSVAAPPPATSTTGQHKRGRSIQTLTQGIMGVGRSGGDAKKVSGSGKR